MKLKNRYVLGFLKDIKPEDTINKISFLNKIKQVCKNLYGEYGSSILEIDLKIKYYNETTNLFIIKINQKSLDILLNILNNDLKINNKTPKIIKISGTIKKCQLKAILFNQKTIIQLKKQYNIEEDNEIIKNLKF